MTRYQVERIDGETGQATTIATPGTEYGANASRDATKADIRRTRGSSDTVRVTKIKG